MRLAWWRMRFRLKRLGDAHEELEPVGGREGGVTGRKGGVEDGFSQGAKS